ncbi:MAG: hypothetical protein K2X86_18390 [Cytophagaceae bacterium]|nr:hypothetical protein [Cytophagaceae bacterium]
MEYITIIAAAGSLGFLVYRIISQRKANRSRETQDALLREQIEIEKRREEKREN